MRRFFPAIPPVKNVEQQPDARLVLTLAKVAAAPVAALAPAVAPGVGWVAEWSGEGGDGWQAIDPPEQSLAGYRADASTVVGEVWPYTPGAVVSWVVSDSEEGAFQWSAGQIANLIFVRVSSGSAAVLTATASLDGVAVGTLTLTLSPPEW